MSKLSVKSTAPENLSCRPNPVLPSFSLRSGGQTTGAEQRIQARHIALILSRWKYMSMEMALLLVFEMSVRTSRTIDQYASSRSISVRILFTDGTTASISARL